MKVINYGSLNIDYVYCVPHISQPGETLCSRAFEIFTGGKGANQSVALARARAKVFHAGKVGVDGKWMLEKLVASGVDVSLVDVSDGKTGHAIIQVDDKGENSIVLFPGANRQITQTEIEKALSQGEKGDILLLQNEINVVPYIIESGHKHGMKICLNPAPFGKEALDYPLYLVDTLIVNEIEGKGLSGKTLPDAIINALSSKFPKAEIILTLGNKGVMYKSMREGMSVPAVKVKPVDTTAAGDTFIGYYLASQMENKPVKESLEIACKAASICVSRKGAQDSIPYMKEVLK
jgi:ribokinase